MLAITWPKEYGGQGLGHIEALVQAEEFAKAGAPAGGPNDGFGIGMLGNTLLQVGTEEQRRRREARDEVERNAQRGRARREGGGPVGAQLDLAADLARGLAEPLPDHRTAKDDVLDVVGKDAVEVMGVPGGDPLLGEGVDIDRLQAR